MHPVSAVPVHAEAVCNAKAVRIVVDAKPPGVEILQSQQGMCKNPSGVNGWKAGLHEGILLFWKEIILTGEWNHMDYRAQQYYKINRQLKKAYHQKVREGAAAETMQIFKDINAHIVESFAQDGLISHEWAAALGHQCHHEA